MSDNKQPTPANGKICYIEMPAIDINTSASFYKNVFGWRIRQRGDGATAFDDATGEVSGAWVLGRPAWSEPGLVFYIMVRDIDATIQAVLGPSGATREAPGVDWPHISPHICRPRSDS